MKNKKLVIAIAVILVAVFGLIGSMSDESETGVADSTTNALLTTTEKATLSETAEATEKVGETEKEITEIKGETTEKSKEDSGVKLSSVSKFSGKAYIILNNNNPEFLKSEITDKSFETYESLDYLGRCGVAFACLGKDIMPTEERGNIGQVKPSGWKTVKYDFVDGKYLYNRCHLIGFQLSGENANTRNLITGTRYMNVEGMLPFENMVADYIKETNNHVMYRVTPVFKGSNLVASGVQIEAYSVEDEGEGICFNVYCYNTQPGVEIDYYNGDSWVSDNDEGWISAETETEETTKKQASASKTDYVLNTNSKKFHYPSCRSAKSMSDKNKSEYSGAREDLINQGYSPCGNCHP